MRKAARLIISLGVLCALVPLTYAETSTATSQAPDSVLTAARAFERMPAKTLDLLTTSMRLDMLDYYNKRDSIYEVENALEGLSRLERPVTADWLKARITPVTTLTIRVLPYKKGKIALSIYTVGDTLQAPDSEIRFYDANMNQLEPSKFIKQLSTKDFFDFTGASPKERDELLELVPFPTVEYYCGPDENELHARLTVGEFLGKETMEKLAPRLRRERVYTWDGAKFRLQP